MPVSEEYVVDYLVRETEARPSAIEWAEGDSSSFAAMYNDVRLRIYSVQNLSGPRLYLECTLAHDRIYIAEPGKVAIFGKQYKTDDEEALAARLHRLIHAIQAQLRHRHAEAFAHEEEIRESIFRQILFGGHAVSETGSAGSRAEF
ncbi:MAG: hypothetical protein HYX27_05235 [Acidobacteria bacterium]|nr:hypothetical protein [Acidobacteriota bacterium]